MGRTTNKVLKSDPEILKNINKDNQNLMSDYIDYLYTTDKSEATIVVYKSNLNIIMCWLHERCANKPYFEITKRDVMNFQNFMVRNKLSSARIRNIRSTMSSLSDYIERMMDDEYPNFRNLIGKIPPPPSNPTREKTIMNEEDLNELLSVLVSTKRYQVACFVAMSAYGGARKAETIQYQASWFNDDNLINGLWKTPTIRTKGSGSIGKKLNKYILKNKVEEYLSLWLNQREELGVDIDDLFVTKENGKWVRAKISTVSSFMETCSNLMEMNIYCHNFRHFFVSHLAKNDIPLEVIADIVGHNSSETTKLYNDNPKEDGFLKYFSEEGIQTIEQKKLSDL
jgi:integrase/recombinase XerD